MNKSCSKCKYLVKQTESWEMPWVSWLECVAKPGIENLKQWPFKNTNCDKYKEQHVTEVAS